MLHSTNSITRIHSIAILAKLALIDFVLMESVLPQIHLLANEYNWEMSAQIIILCANILECINEKPLSEEQKKETNIDVEKIAQEAF